MMLSTMIAVGGLQEANIVPRIRPQSQATLVYKIKTHRSVVLARSCSHAQVRVAL